MCHRIRRIYPRANVSGGNHKSVYHFTIIPMNRRDMRNGNWSRFDLVLIDLVPMGLV